MTFEITETVFTYPKSLLDSWKQGEKSWIPSKLFVPPEVHNQPRYHFGEYFALTKYLELGWEGRAYFPLGIWEPNNPKYNDGRALIAKYLDPVRLDIFRAIRSNRASGEPDLMLFKDDGSILFVEVKKQTDRLSKEQLNCLSQIKSILGCDVEIAYLAEEGRNYTPKTYQLDLIELPATWLERN